MTSAGQWNHGTAKAIYSWAGQRADLLVQMGKITESGRQAQFAAFAAQDLARAGLPVPKGIAAGAGRMAADTAMRAAGAAASGAAKATAFEVAKGVARGGLPVTAALFAAEGVHTLYKCASGDIDATEACRRTAKSAAANGGGLAGAALGAAVGSAVFPGLGTFIGSIVGGVSGGAFLGGFFR